MASEDEDGLFFNFKGTPNLVSLCFCIQPWISHFTFLISIRNYLVPSDRSAVNPLAQRRGLGQTTLLTAMSLDKNMAKTTRRTEQTQTYRGQIVLCMPKTSLLDHFDEVSILTILILIFPLWSFQPIF